MKTRYILITILIVMTSGSCNKAKESSAKTVITNQTPNPLAGTWKMKRHILLLSTGCNFESANFANTPGKDTFISQIDGFSADIDSFTIYNDGTFKAICASGKIAYSGLCKISDAVLIFDNAQIVYMDFNKQAYPMSMLYWFIKKSKVNVLNLVTPYNYKMGEYGDPDGTIKKWEVDYVKTK